MMSELYRKMQPFLGDEQQLMHRMAGRMDLWEECVRLFPREEIVAEMDEAVETGDDTALYKTVHRLKGNLANFGFDAAAGHAMAILQALKEEKREQAVVWYGKLRGEYLQMIERMVEAK